MNCLRKGHTAGPREADLIARCFAPLSLDHPAARGLLDDVAFIAPGGPGLVVTTDHIVEGTHVLASDPLDAMARKLVRRNLSDLVAKGAVPAFAVLNIAWPHCRPLEGLEAFSAALGEELRERCGGCALIGGDTTRINGPLCASMTLFGTMRGGRAEPVGRDGARPGDLLCVTGEIGDAWLGLQARLGRAPATGRQAAIQVSMVPVPPSLGFADLVARHAHGSLDVSDGLLIDVMRLASASGLAARIELDRLPLSAECAAWVAGRPDTARALLDLASGGDDYQTVMAVQPAALDAFLADADRIGQRVTIIGVCGPVAEHGAEGGLVVELTGRVLDLPADLGWDVG